MIKVAAYCRVSTDSDDQINSLLSQKKFFQEYIERNPEWRLIHVYSDEGITGTSTKKRKAFNQMIADGENGLFDLVLTKEISRFARNTLDSIFYTRKLKELGIGVFFLNDNINTLEPDSELRLTLMSGIAQEESRRTSQRVKWGQKRRMEAGIVFGRSVLGYDITGGQLIINEKEAETVRLIFKKYLMENKGVNTICKELEREGRLTKNGCKNWHTSSIYKILQNEKLTGDLLQKKTYTPDYLTHTSKPNNGSEEVVFIQGHHEPIIDRRTFEDTQSEIRRRSVKAKKEQRRHSNRYPFSGKIICGICGSAFVRRKRGRPGCAVRITWQCGKQVKYGRSGSESNGCANCILSDEAVQELFSAELRNAAAATGIDMAAVNQAVRQAVSQALTEESENPSEEINRRLRALANKKHGLVDLYFEGIITKEDFKLTAGRYDKQIAELKERLPLVESKTASDGSALSAVYASIDRLCSLRGFSDELCRQLLDKIVVNGRNEVDVLLKP